VSARRARRLAVALILVAAAGPLDGENGLMFRRIAGPAGGTGFDDGYGSLAQFSYPRGVAVDAGGACYVADTWNHTIRKIEPSGRVTTLAGKAGHAGFADGKGAQARFYEPMGLALDGQGNLIVADSRNRRIRKVSPAGVVTTLAGSGAWGSADGPAASASFVEPGGVAVRADDVVFVADTGSQKIRVLENGVVSTLAGSGVEGWADGAGSVAQFRKPTALVVADGALYVADRENYRVRRVTFQGDVSTAAGDGTWGHVDGPVATARFGLPDGIALGPAGDLWVADSGYGAVRRIDLGQGLVSTVAGGGPWGVEDGPVAAARFAGLYGIGLDSSGNVFLADAHADRIRKISTSGIVSTVAGSWTYGFADGAGAHARFNRPDGVAVSESGVVFVSDPGNSRIRRIDVSGNVTTAAGDGTWGYRDGPAAQARFDGPRGLALDAGGNLYVADQANNRIRKVDAQGVVSTYAGTGTPGYLDGPRSSAQFYHPFGVAVDADGNVYVGDSLNFRIRKIDSSGQVSTLAGDGTQGYVDGPGGSARFSYSTRLAVDSAGNVVVADEFNCRIRKVTPEGTVSTIAGTNPCGFADGTGPGARFYQPRGVAVDGSGNVFVADSENHRIRRIDPTGVVTTVGGDAAAGCAEGTGPTAGFANPVGIAVDPATGDLVVVDTRNGTVVVGTPGLPDLATIDQPVAPVGFLRQLDSAPQTATSWGWQVIRRPTGSLAELSSTSARNPTFTPDVEDLYVFRLAALDDSGNASGSLVTLLSPPACVPPVVPVISGGGLVCEGGTVSVTASHVPGATYSWSGPNGFVSTDQSPVIGPMTLADSGMYTVVLLVDGCRSEPASTSLIVEPRPPLPVVSAPATVEPGEVFSLSVPDAPSTTWWWVVTNGSISSGQGTRMIEVVAGSAGALGVRVDATSLPLYCSSELTTLSIPVVGPSSTGFYPIAPCRLLDTRESTGEQAATPALGPGETRTFSVEGRCGLSRLTTRSLSANLTATASPSAGEIVAFRGDLSDPPATASLVWPAGKTRANNAIVELSRLRDGTFRVHNRSEAPVDFILDVNGVFW
jgi:sugar lactone lactonase YvrE